MPRTESSCRRVLRALSFVMVATLACLASRHVSAGTVTIELQSGRTMTATIDPRTDEHRLWLRFESPSMTILRPIRWHDIAGFVIAGISYTAQQQVAAALEHAEPQTAAIHRLPLPASMPRQTADAPRREHRNMADLATEALSAAPRVTSVRAEAYLANWDADVEPDGLVVEVSPLASDGAAVRVDGTVEVELFAPRPPMPLARPRVARIGRWVRTFQPDDLGISGLVFKLPFQAIDPSFDLEIAAHGLVHIRLNVPGHGTLETTLTDVRVRPYSALRDQLQQTEGRRFLPSERTRRSR